MSVALRLYEQLSEAQDDKTRARLIAEAFAQLEDHYPPVKDLATQGQVRETELRLQKEIKEVEAKLQKEIREVEARLRLEIEKVRLEIREVEVRLAQAIHRQTLWVIGSVGAVIGLIRLLEWLLVQGPNP
jgi:C4-dicarboxylate-specific signal transduction histidine kinase